jgi:hypothetical protein
VEEIVIQSLPISSGKRGYQISQITDGSENFKVIKNPKYSTDAVSKAKAEFEPFITSVDTVLDIRKSLLSDCCTWVILKELRNELTKAVPNLHDRLSVSLDIYSRPVFTKSFANDFKQFHVSEAANAITNKDYFIQCFTKEFLDFAITARYTVNDV